MKRNILIFLMLLIMLFTGVVGNFAVNTSTEQKPAAQQPQMGSQENPAPPDLKNLEMLSLEPFQSNLPVVMIDTGRQQIVKESMKSVKVAIFDDPSGENDILDHPDRVLNAGLKLRGASSYNFDKNQYRLKFFRKQNLKKPLSYGFLGMAPDSEWVLHGPYLDMSLLRNYLMYHLSREVMDWAPDCTFLELFVDGRYQGVYLAIEPITEGSSRLRLSPFGLLSGATPYVVVRDRIGTEANAVIPYGSQMGLTPNQLSVRYPSRKDLTPAQKLWIQEDLSQFEKALYSDHLGDPETGYAQYIDVDSFVDYLILNEISINHDAGNLSTYIYKELGGKLQLSVWDFNNSFDNYQWFDRPTDEFELAENGWFDRLLQDRNFVDRVVARYRQLRSGSLSDDHMQQILLDGRQTLGPAIPRNFSRWGYTFRNHLMSVGEGKPDRNPESYPEAFNRLLQIMHRRTDFLDQHIEDLYEGCIN